MKISNGNYLSINEIADRYLKFSGTAQTSEKAEEQKSFAEILSDKRSVLEAASGLNFSKHATERLSSRNIEMSAEQLERLTEGVNKASAKGINDSLVMVDTLAFIVNTRSQTVVTAMDSTDTSKDGVFSNIDGAVIA
ncbi:TIGR02530 family flagellar biosynthesis protein [Lachnospiraceae bacterium C1.1]|nr:TIGR02530 family flagellar biosynthesis protein [Lachnospiraceae bacterium C1.1]